MNDELRQACLAILREEMQAAVGCTEPLALACAAALLKKHLGDEPEWIQADISGNIIKNVKSVTVPNTGGLRGLRAAIAAGVAAGDPDAGLKVLAHAPADAAQRCRQYLKRARINVSRLESKHTLDIRLRGYRREHCVCVRITAGHTNVVYLERDGEVLIDRPVRAAAEAYLTDRSVLDLHGIVHFAQTAEYETLRDIFAPQVEMNLAIAQEGLRRDWGSNIGKLMLEMDDSPAGQAAAYAAAGSDARMSGCALPVMILSGSGNQGLTASVPVIRYAQTASCTQDTLYRALAVSSLTTIHLKTGVGKLSAYCGAISAGCAAGAGIAYLRGADAELIAQTVSNALGLLSGTICDGAKPSCAGKIAMAVRAGILGYEMARTGNSLCAGDGIIGADPEQTVRSAGIVAREGMYITDQVILDIMLESKTV